MFSVAKVKTTGRVFSIDLFTDKDARSGYPIAVQPIEIVARTYPSFEKRLQRVDRIAPAWNCVIVHALGLVQVGVETNWSRMETLQRLVKLAAC